MLTTSVNANFQLLQVITEIVSPDFLLDDERPISSSDTLDDCSSSGEEESTTPPPGGDNAAICVPSSHQQSECDSCFHRDSSGSRAGDLEGDAESHTSSRGKIKSPITWRKSLEQAPYADEETFSIAEVEDIENMSDKQVTFFYHM